MEWYLTSISKYTFTKGRAHKKEFWSFMLYHILFFIIFTLLDNVLRINIEYFPFGYFTFIYFLLTLIPFLSLSIRRLHDVNKNGKLVYLYLIPILGWFVLLIHFTTNSYFGRNKYGTYPKRYLYQ